MPIALATVGCCL